METMILLYPAIGQLSGILELEMFWSVRSSGGKGKQSAFRGER
ncbi:hypothetical protein [Halobacillus locisalis]|nr:hypothetical protein [Halobacillus locisalis]